MHYPASTIAAALGTSKATVLRRAKAQGWAMVRRWNCDYYTPPESIAAQCAAISPADIPSEAPTVTFGALTHSPEARAKVIAREEATLELTRLCRAGHPRELALRAVCTAFAGRLPNISSSSLRRWEKAYEAHGIDGLVEQKLGHSGAKPSAAHLTDEIIARGKALAAEHGSVAKAARILTLDPNLPAQLRERLHEAHMSKSYVTPSIAAAIRPSQATIDLLQGPRHARLQGRFTLGSYDDLPAGDWWTSDDMTSNVYCWVEDSSPRGWRIAQAQILPVLDIGSLRWLGVRVIVREGGQYSGDDIWGLFGDIFDSFGLPKRGFLLEGGHWRSNRVLGHKTGLSDDDRIGGLKSLGLDVQRSLTPRSKHIEQCFNQLQYWADAAIGYAGRDQRKQLPEQVKKQLALCHGGHTHPRQFFLHQTQLADHLQAQMENMNNERSDGKILKGQSPLEKWSADAPLLARVPESATWLYRSAMTIAQVTRNGVRVAQGSGKKLMVHYYDNPELFVPRQGSQVIIYWNDHRPEADAAILDRASRKFIGLASYVAPISRFGASEDELETEARRKAAAMQFARTEIREIQPHLQRRVANTIPTSRGTEITGQAIADAEARAAALETARETRRETMRKVDVCPTDREAILDIPRDTFASSELMDRTDAMTAPDTERMKAEDIAAMLAELT